MADTHTWVGGSSEGGGWNTAANWRNEVGETECPVAGDSVLFNQVGETVVANDEDAALFCSLKRVQLNAWSSATKTGQTVVLDVSTNVTVGAAVNGNGLFVKRGAGTATMDSTDTTGTAAVYGSYTGVYEVGYDGVRVEAGTLVMPQGKSIKYGIGVLTVETGATFVLPDADFIVSRLMGGGTVQQLIADGYKIFQIGFGNTPTDWTVFSGKITGRIRVYSYGYQAFTGTETDLTHGFYIYTGRGYDKRYGITGLLRFGSKADAGSSIGKPSDNTLYLMYLGNLLYLGEGETTDRNIQIDTRPNGGVYPNTFDAGAHGGLRLNGALEWAAWGAGGNECWQQNAFVFTGSNAAPCTLAGPLTLKFLHGSTNFNHYIIKKGTGTWRFEQNAKTTHRGVYDVREGTLQFDTLASAGKLCALGYGDAPIDEYYGPYNPDKASAYALRLGTPGSTNAVLEYVGSGSGVSTNRKMLVSGDARLRVSGEGPFDFSDVTATGAVKTLTLDGNGTGTKYLRNVSGSLSIVKEGAGTWNLLDNQTFSGDLIVRGGSLKLGAAPQVHRYFRVAFLNGYGNPHGCYIVEFALYDKNGNRVNRGLTYAKPDDVAWAKTYYADKVARTLAAGTMAFDSLKDGVACQAYTYETTGKLAYFTDGTTSQAQFVNCFATNTPGVVSMRLADDCPEVGYLDFCQSTGSYLSADEKKLPQYANPPYYQTASSVVLESSPDGITWTKVAERTDLPINTSAHQWYFSPTKASVSTDSDVRDVNNGEGLAFSTRAVSFDERGGDKLTNVGYVSVAGGATLEVASEDLLTVSRVRIDADAGSGAFQNIRFASAMTVDITGLQPRESRTVAVDFTGVANFDEVESWTFLENGQPTKAQVTLTKTSLEVSRLGMTIIVR